MIKETHSGTTECDIAIAGGGLVGLTLALLLARETPHLRVTMLDPYGLDEADNTKAVDNRTTALSKGTAKLFKALGIWPLITPFATPIQHVDVSDKGHVGLTSFPAQEHLNQEYSAKKAKLAQGASREALGYVVQNHGLAQVLLSQVRASASITLLPHTVTRFTPKVRGGVVDYKGSDNTSLSLLTQCLVVADGAQSSLRDTLGIQTSHHDYQQHAIITTLTHSKPHAGTAYERFTPQGPMALLPFGGHVNARQSALVWTRPKALFQASFDLPDKQLLAHIQQQFGYRLGVFEQVVARHHYPLHLVLAKEQVRSSLVILGNAAHFLHPVAGQGFNLSVRDCGALVATFTYASQQKLALGAMSVLARYQAQQALDQQATVQISDKFIQLFSHTSPAVQLIRNAGLLALQKAPPVQSAFFSLMMGQGFTRPVLTCEREYNRGHNQEQHRAHHQQMNNPQVTNKKALS